MASQIAAELGRSEDTITRNLKRAGVSMRAYRDYHAAKVDEGFFAVIDNQDKAYWLGYLAADACTGLKPKVNLAMMVEPNGPPTSQTECRLADEAVCEARPDHACGGCMKCEASVGKTLEICAISQHSGRYCEAHPMEAWPTDPPDVDVLRVFPCSLPCHSFSDGKQTAH